MASQDVETFMSITGCDRAVAEQSLRAHGDINRAVDAFLNNEGVPISPHEVEDMEEDLPSTATTFVQPPPPFGILSPFQRISAPNEPRAPWPFEGNRFSETWGLGDRTRPLQNTAPQVAFPPDVRDVRDVPIEWHDEEEDDNSGLRHAHPRGPVIEELTGGDDSYMMNIPGHVDPSVEELPSSSPLFRPAMDLTRPRVTERHGYNVTDDVGPFNPHAPAIAEVSGINDDDDIQEQMLQAAIEASKREAEIASQRGGPIISEIDSPTRVGLRATGAAEDDDLARAVSLSLKTLEEEKALRERGEGSGAAFMVEDDDDSDEERLRRLAFLRGSSFDRSTELGGRGLGGNSSTGFGQEGQPRGTEGNLAGDAEQFHIEEIEDTEDDQPLFRRPSSRRTNVSAAPSGSAALPALSVMDVLPARPQPYEEDQAEQMPPAEQHGLAAANSSQQNGGFPEEWGGISSEEHDEAVMLEAAIFGGLPETDIPHPYQQRHPDLDALGVADNMYPRRVPQQPSPAVEAQRRIREEQDAEFQQSLAADHQKALRAAQEAEERRRQDEAAAAAAEAQERLRQEEELRLQHAQEELERQLAVKRASLPPEPASDDENAVKLVVRMPDSSRRGRRFLKSDKLQVLFDFLDCSEDIKPGSYRLATAYPRRMLTDKQHEETFQSLGLSSKQELLNLDLI